MQLDLLIFLFVCVDVDVCACVCVWRTKSASPVASPCDSFPPNNNPHSQTSSNCAAEQSNLMICMRRRLYTTSPDQGQALITRQVWEEGRPPGCVWDFREGVKKKNKQTTGWGIDGSSWETWSGKLMIRSTAGAAELESFRWGRKIQKRHPGAQLSHPVSSGQAVVLTSVCPSVSHEYERLI